VTDEPRPPYERPPLTKEYLRGEAGDEKLVKQPASFYEDAGIELRTGIRAEALDVRGRSLTLRGGASVRFDRLLLATGSLAIRPRFGGIDAPWVHVVRTAADADCLRDAAGNSSSAVVAGGGWIGAETAASLRQVGLAVTLVLPGREVLERHLGAELGRELSDLQERHGVRLVRSSRVSALREAGGKREVVLDTGEVLATDLAVLGLGAVPSQELAIAAGIGADDGVLVDERLRSSADVVFAAGDVASAWTPRYRDRVRSAHWDNARRQGGQRRETCSAWQRCTTGCRTSTPTSTTSAWRASGAPTSAKTSTSAVRTKEWSSSGRATALSSQGRMRTCGTASKCSTG
jgi:3-phenylpropionate/trans-cinnamate dioxygenase ferredoxin reductase subunit